MLSLKTRIDYKKYSSIFSTRRNFPYFYIPLQLKEGTILLYDKYNISLLNKNFKLSKIYSFDQKYEEEDIEVKHFITNVKQLKCGKILCCNKDLFIFNIKLKNASPKIINIPNDEYILDVIELKNGIIIGCTNKSLIDIKLIKNKNDEEYEISNIMKNSENFYIIPRNGKIHIYFKQYVNIYELPNNKLLLHSHSSELIFGRCGTHPPAEVYDNKFFIYDLNNQAIIHTFKPLEGETNIIILNKYICICYYGIINIYDINDYSLKKEVIDKFNARYFTKYDENSIIGISILENENNIILYNIQEISNIKFIIYKESFMKFKSIKYNVCYDDRRNKNKSIYKLKDGSILIECHGRIYIVEIPKFIDNLSLRPLKEIEYTQEELDEMKNTEILYI